MVSLLRLSTSDNEVPVSEIRYLYKSKRDNAFKPCQSAFDACQYLKYGYQVKPQFVRLTRGYMLYA